MDEQEQACVRGSDLCESVRSSREVRLSCHELQTGRNAFGESCVALPEREEVGGRRGTLPPATSHEQSMRTSITMKTKSSIIRSRSYGKGSCPTPQPPFAELFAPRVPRSATAAAAAAAAAPSGVAAAGRNSASR